ncbi:MAG: peptidylprolyl isomerase [Sphingobacteriaceae bacterium]|nr:MAG: peptidylprolyl isomerase [Sphingobacteriaceae bacterium]
MKKYLLLLSVVILGLSACKKVDFDAEQVAIDEAKIQAYIAANPTTAGGLTKDASGIYYKILNAGAGPYPTETSTIKVSFKGTLLNGATFDQSSALTIKLSSTIKGWQAGMLKVKGPSAAGATDGGKIYMIIPSALAYGSSSFGNVSANSVLVFTIELTGVGA